MRGKENQRSIGSSQSRVGGNDFAVCGTPPAEAFQEMELALLLSWDQGGQGCDPGSFKRTTSAPYDLRAQSEHISV